MKIPLSWLKEYLDVDVPAEELAERLTFSGLEVESIEKIGSDFKGVVVGEVLHITPHPHAERLSICRVYNGQEQVQVVCGAHDFTVGDKVPFACIGTTLPNGQTIKQAAIQGESSQGILCAEDELGISDDHSGLMVLSRDLSAGKPFSEVMGPPEFVLIIEVTPNRPDCLSVMGVAREVGALYGKSLKFPDLSLHESGKPVESYTTVRVNDSEGCQRYTARILSDVTIKPAPLWMRKRLIQCGIRPINNVVDITNYVMLECGQPLHAFDQALLAQGSIVVRRAKPNERIITLENTDCALTPEMLLIADHDKPVAVAGVMGGISSSILPTTSTVLLESACFKPALIRRSSKALGLSTESSYRFEHGVDIQLVEWASRRAASLMAELAGAVVARGVIDLFPVKPKKRKIVCRFDRVKKLLGKKIPARTISSIFESLALPVSDRNTKSCTVEAPSFRPDINNEADLIEEVVRIYGLDKIPAPSPKCLIVPDVDDAPTRAVMRCRSHLVGLGLSEIMNYSFLSEQLLDRFNSGETDQRVILQRPTSAEYAILRNSLLPQMGETLARNHSRQIREAAFFELGRVFFRSHNDEQVMLREEERLAIGLMGPVGWSGFDKQKVTEDQDMFLWLKGIFESLCSSLSIQKRSRQIVNRCDGDLSFRTLTGNINLVKDFPVDCLEKNRSVLILLDEVICGIFGLVNRDIRKEWRLTEPVAILETRLQPLLQYVFKTPALMPIPAYPSVVRDIAVIVDERVTHDNIVSAIDKIALKELTSIQLFDIFRSEQIGEGYKSMAYSMTYCSLDRTLTDDEVNTFHIAIKAGIRKQLKAEIRES